MIYLDYTLQMHGNPSELFFSCLWHEVRQNSTLSTVMREESEAVLVMQVCGGVASGFSILAGLFVLEWNER